MKTVLSILIFLLLLFSAGPEPKVVFRSAGLEKLTLKLEASRDSILDDEGERVGVDLMQDANGMIYWRRQLYTPVCLTGECKAIDVGIYWDCTGNFAGLEVYQMHLTRTDHSVFSEEDYAKLIAVLQDDWSILREYDYEDLINEPAEGVDAVTGATKKEISEETVDGAVYTTFTLWHLVNQGEKDQLKTLTAGLLNEDASFFQLLIGQTDTKYRSFLLELLRDGKLQASAALNELLLEALEEKDDPYLRELAYKALDKIDFNKVALQEQLAVVYRTLAVRERTRILNALDTGIQLDASLFQALTQDLSVENEWMAAKTLSVIRLYPEPGPEIMAIAQQLAKSENSFVKKKALEFMER
jgi:hypothetical protein